MDIRGCGTFRGRHSISEVLFSERTRLRRPRRNEGARGKRATALPSLVMVQLIDSDELSLMPVPASFYEPFYTIHMRAPGPIPAERIAAILGALPGVREVAPPEPRW